MHPLEYHRGARDDCRGSAGTAEVAAVLVSWQGPGTYRLAGVTCRAGGDDLLDKGMAIHQLAVVR